MKYAIKINFPENWNNNVKDFNAEKITSRLSSMLNVFLIEHSVVGMKAHSVSNKPDELLLEGKPVLGSIEKLFEEIKETLVKGACELAKYSESLPTVEIKVIEESEQATEEAVDDDESAIAAEEEIAEEDDEEEEGSAQDVESIRAGIMDLLRGLDSASKKASAGKGARKKSSKKEDPYASVKKKLGELVGAEEFKKLCNEIMDIAPQIKKNGTQSLFAKQCYLFSIGDGDGLSTYLSILGEVIDTAGIREVCDYDPVEDTLVYSLSDRNAETFIEEQKDKLRKLRRRSGCSVICMDVSDWISYVSTSKFKSYLRVLEKELDNFIVALRVPYLDKEVLDHVAESVEDVLFTRVISVPPFAMEDYRQLTYKELKKYGYKMSPAAWEFVAKRLTEEKSDGKFYGVDTLKKVLSELIYKKQVANAHVKAPTDTIGKSEARALCSGVEEFIPENALNDLVGMEEVKQKLLEIIAQIEYSSKVEGEECPCIHMRFLGGPGTGKTTVARILGKILKEKKILRVGNFFEYSGRNFCGRYIGETAPKTIGMCRDAYGSVLFIDEAYSLYRGGDDTKDFGREALDTLIAEMENHRDDMLVIMAGYTDDMNRMMEGNVGLHSRMPYTIEFKNYNKEQLYNIFLSFLNKKYTYDPEVATAAKEYFDSLDDSFIQSKEFSNGRFVRNLYERTWAKAVTRREMSQGKIHIIKEDFMRSIADDEFKKNVQGSRKRIGFGFID